LSRDVRLAHLARVAVRFAHLAWQLRRCAPTAAARAKLLVTVLWLGTARRLGRDAVRPIGLEVAPHGREFTLTVNNLTEIEVMVEVFLTGEYDALPDSLQPQTIVDLGGHIGVSAGHFATKFPDARVLAVEPYPPTFARLRRASERLPNLTIRCAAATDRDGPIALRVYPDAWVCSTSTPDGEDAAAPRVTVDGCTVDTLCRDFGVERLDLLKVDIEGAECEVLRAFSGLATTRAVIGEFHPYLAGCSLEAFEGLFEGFDVAIEDAGDTKLFLALNRNA
jgi:FkbM family methyltransferase